MNNTDSTTDCLNIIKINTATAQARSTTTQPLQDVDRRVVKEHEG
jgi:hypothetical protein